MRSTHARPGSRRATRVSALVPLVVGIHFAVSAFIPSATSARDIDGLILYLPLDEGAGATGADPRGNGHEGELLGDASWGDGKFRGGVNFGGDDGYVRVPHHDEFDFTEGLTVAAWIRPTLDAGPGTWQLIAAKGQDAAEFFEILLNPAGFLWMGWQFEGGRVVPDQTTPSVLADEWQHVAVSYQIGEWWNVHLDGEVLIEYPPEDQALVPNADDLLLGVEEPLALNRFYSGDIDEFVLYDRGLTQEELLEIIEGMAELLPVSPDGLRATGWGDLKDGYSR